MVPREARRQREEGIGNQPGEQDRGHEQRRADRPQYEELRAIHRGRFLALSRCSLVVALLATLVVVRVLPGSPRALRGLWPLLGARAVSALIAAAGDNHPRLVAQSIGAIDHHAIARCQPGINSRHFVVGGANFDRTDRHRVIRIDDINIGSRCATLDRRSRNRDDAVPPFLISRPSLNPTSVRWPLICVLTITVASGVTVPRALTITRISPVPMVAAPGWGTVCGARPGRPTGAWPGRKTS
jgi:hypothetical protein